MAQNSSHIDIATSLAEACLVKSDQNLAQPFCGCLVSAVCRCKSSEMPAKTPRNLAVELRQVSVCLLDSLLMRSLQSNAFIVTMCHLQRMYFTLLSSS